MPGNCEMTINNHEHLATIKSFFEHQRGALAEPKVSSVPTFMHTKWRNPCQKNICTAHNNKQLF